MNSTFNQHIGIFDNAFSKEWCNDLIKTFEDNHDSLKNRQDFENASTLEKKDTFYSLMENHPIFCEEFSDKFWKNIYPVYCDEYSITPRIISHENLFLHEFKIQKTLPSGGYHVWHNERHWNIGTTNRVMVYTLYLNDVEEGGETEFLIQSKRVKPKQGTVVLFPAEYTHIHRGNPPISNVKYIMTGWIEYIPHDIP